MGEHLRSKTRTEPSAETEAKTPAPPPPQAMSYTSRSCAMSWVSTTPFCRQLSLVTDSEAGLSTVK